MKPLTLGFLISKAELATLSVLRPLGGYSQRGAYTGRPSTNSNYCYHLTYSSKKKEKKKTRQPENQTW